MRHKKQKSTLGRKTGQRKALLRTLSISLIENGRVITTPAKAKAVQQLVEPLITTGKDKTQHSMRKIEKKLANKVAVRKVVGTLGPQFKDRKGGYTSITKIADRKGDGAKQVVLEFVSK